MGEMRGKETACDEEFAEKLSVAIDTYVKSATVTIDEGITVSGAADPALEIGRTSGKGTGTIS